MKKIITLNLIIFFLKINFALGQNVIFKTNKNVNTKDWVVINDDVMGGVSSSNISVNKEGFLQFFGNISLKNNGGFASVSYKCKKMVVENKTKIQLRLKGDGKKYQLRIKEKIDDYYSYVASFQTTGNWETISIYLKEMYPSFRGRTLDLKNFNENSFEQISFLIGNNKRESFKLIIDEIILK